MRKWVTKPIWNHWTDDRYRGISGQYWYNQDDLNLYSKLSIHKLAFETFTSVILLSFVVSFRVLDRFHALNYRESLSRKEYILCWW